MVVTLGQDGASLTLTPRFGHVHADGNQAVEAFLEHPGLSARRVIWLGGPGPSLAEVFGDLAQAWRGWDGVKRWSTHEGDLALAFTHDGLGHIRMAVELRAFAERGDWTATGTVLLDAGALERHARELRGLGADVTEIHR